MLLFTLDGALFTFRENNPAFAALFQFPPRFAARFLYGFLSPGP